MVFQRLYVRIWLAVVAAVAVLTFLVGMAWRMHAEPPLREVVVRNIQGEIIGRGSARPKRLEPNEEARSGSGALESPTQGPRGRRFALPPEGEPEGPGRFGRGPEFEVQLQDGQIVHLHLPRPPRSPWMMPLVFSGL